MLHFPHYSETCTFKNLLPTQPLQKALGRNTNRHSSHQRQLLWSPCRARDWPVFMPPCLKGSSIFWLLELSCSTAEGFLISDDGVVAFVVSRTGLVALDMFHFESVEEEVLMLENRDPNPT
mmetsp:Transcript_9417/g.15109  ORF Transcript_9417/g.15109 Transcript_9417/m.15109 type:complete len:121 (-) Transcript_9417:2248-2610(-)